jgi:hypothetical protein
VLGAAVALRLARGAAAAGCCRYRSKGRGVAAAAPGDAALAAAPPAQQQQPSSLLVFTASPLAVKLAPHARVPSAQASAVTPAGGALPTVGAVMPASRTPFCTWLGAAAAAVAVLAAVTACAALLPCLPWSMAADSSAPALRLDLSNACDSARHGRLVALAAVVIAALGAALPLGLAAAAARAEVGGACFRRTDVQGSTATAACVAPLAAAGYCPGWGLAEAALPDCAEPSPWRCLWPRRRRVRWRHCRCCSRRAC